MIKHILSKDDQELARDIANKRYQNNRDTGVEDKQVGGQDKDFIDLNGFGGELAFCRAFGSDPDLAITPGGGEGGIDTHLSEGRAVDVKTTKYRSGNLVAREIHSDVDIFVLVRGEFPSYQIVGYTDRAAFQQQGKKDIGHGPTHFMHARKLRPIEDLTR